MWQTEIHNGCQDFHPLVFRPSNSLPLSVGRTGEYDGNLTHTIILHCVAKGILQDGIKVPSELDLS